MKTESKSNLIAEPPRWNKQIHFGENGNCLAACVAGMLDIPIGNVPEEYRMAATQEAGIQWKIHREFLRQYGIRPASWKVWTWTERQIANFWLYIGSESPVLVSGKSARGFDHATVYRNGELFFDPHPDGTGIERILEIELWILLDPGRLLPLPEAIREGMRNGG